MGPILHRLVLAQDRGLQGHGPVVGSQEVLLGPRERTVLTRDLPPFPNGVLQLYVVASMASSRPTSRDLVARAYVVRRHAPCRDTHTHAPRARRRRDGINQRRYVSRHHHRFSTNTMPRWSLSAALPADRAQRRDQHDPGQRELDGVVARSRRARTWAPSPPGVPDDPDRSCEFVDPDQLGPVVDASKSD